MCFTRPHTLPRHIWWTAYGVWAHLSDLDQVQVETSKNDQLLDGPHTDFSQTEDRIRQLRGGVHTASYRYRRTADRMNAVHRPHNP